MATTAPIISADCPARVPLSNAPLGIWGSLRTGRRDVLQLIPEIATPAPIISGRTAKRWHMVMSPAALRRILRDNVGNDPKSVVTGYPALPPSCHARRRLRIRCWGARSATATR